MGQRDAFRRASAPRRLGNGKFSRDPRGRDPRGSRAFGPALAVPARCSLRRLCRSPDPARVVQPDRGERAGAGGRPEGAAQDRTFHGLHGPGVAEPAARGHGSWPGCARAGYPRSGGDLLHPAPPPCRSEGAGSGGGAARAVLHAGKHGRGRGAGRARGSGRGDPDRAGDLPGAAGPPSR